jgi:single-stranded DNA-binding protein
MGTKKIYDLAVKTGSYTDREGNTKNRYVNCGAIFEKDDGSKFITINRTFNPAGVPNPDNKEMVILSQFDLREKNGGSSAPPPSPAPKPQQKRNTGFDDMDDDIPF